MSLASGLHSTQDASDIVADRGSCRRTPGRLSVAASAASFISLTGKCSRRSFASSFKEEAPKRRLTGSARCARWPGSIRTTSAQPPQGCRRWIARTSGATFPGSGRSRPARGHTSRARPTSAGDSSSSRATSTSRAGAGRLTLTRLQRSRPSSDPSARHAIRRWSAAPGGVSLTLRLIQAAREFHRILLQNFASANDPYPYILSVHLH